MDRITAFDGAAAALPAPPTGADAGAADGADPNALMLLEVSPPHEYPLYSLVGLPPAGGDAQARPLEAVALAFPDPRFTVWVAIAGDRVMGACRGRAGRPQAQAAAGSCCCCCGNMPGAAARLFACRAGHGPPA